MAADRRTATRSVVEQLLAKPGGFSFYQAVEILRATNPEAAPLGHNGPVEEEPLRFRPDSSLDFPATDISGIEPLARTDDAEVQSNRPRYLLTITFLGLYGSSSPLPAFYAEEIAQGDQEMRNRREFLDLFHHRVISLFYRVWKKYRYYVQYRRGGHDTFSRRMLCFAGLGVEAIPASLQIERRERLLGIVGALAMRSRSPGMMASAISRFFENVPTEVEPFRERWVTIAEPQRVRLGQANGTLGADATCGVRLRDISGMFRVHLGPIGFETFRKHLPDGEHHAPLRALVRFLLKDPLAFDLQLSLKEEEVPRLTLDRDGPCRLGWSSWLGGHRDIDLGVVFRGG